ncbi:MAG: hypothetical protein LBT14_02905 [Treponema sp.]|jgi:hypothetical protein|nr:hypothetical protein [Treponema sp.]
MNRRFQTYLLWGSHAPLSTLAGGGLLIMASSHLAFALVVAGALVWVYELTAMVVFFAKPFFPQKGKIIVLIFLSSLIGSFYLLLFWLASPFLAMGVSYVIMLIPGYCIGSDLFGRLNSVDDPPMLREVLLKALLEAAALGIFIIAFALIREPLGFMSLSLPGGATGIIQLVEGYDEDSILPIRVLSTSVGALLLFGYGMAIFRNLRNQYHGENRR